MTIQERCKIAEAGLEEISMALLDYRPGTLDECEMTLQEIAGLLDRESLEPAGLPTSGDRPALMALRQRAALLGLQVQQAANLCRGWAQLQLSEGYSCQGTPLLPPSAPQASYEV
jgi:hypothetical protein